MSSKATDAGRLPSTSCGPAGQEAAAKRPHDDDEPDHKEPYETNVYILPNSVIVERKDYVSIQATHGTDYRKARLTPEMRNDLELLESLHFNGAIK